MAVRNYQPNATAEAIEIPRRFNSEEAINLTVDELEAAAGESYFNRVWIYDVESLTGDPTSKIGPVTIFGIPGTNQAYLEIIVAPAPVEGAQLAEYALPDPPRFAFSYSGAVEMRGLAITSAELRTISHFGGSVTGDIGILGANPHDTIEAGVIWRVQAFGVTQTDGSILGGNLHADVRATNPDEFYTDQQGVTHRLRALRYVVAGRSITGDVIAAATSGEASIDTVKVGPVPNDFGITGSIRADNGLIRAVFCSAPIGNAAGTSIIRAGRGIEQVRTRFDPDDVPSPALEPKPMRAQIQGIAPSLTGDRRKDGALQLLEVGGDLEGPVHVGNIVQIGPDGPGALTRAGILVRGRILDNITVDYTSEGDIVAQSIDANVWIGGMMEASVVAWRPAIPEIGQTAGQIQSLTIGRSTTLPTNYAFNFPPGFLGHDLQALDVDRSNPANVLATWYGSSAPEEGSLCSLVSAPHIGNIDISLVARWAHFEEAGDEQETEDAFRPSIEANTINALSISDFREGVVWSGDATLEDKYTDMVPGPRGTGIAIGCMGPGADLWVQNPVAMVVLGSVAGEVHFANMPANDLLLIRDSLTKLFRDDVRVHGPLPLALHDVL